MNTFLRWAGSKRKLLPKLAPYWGNGFDRYIEPFAGSASLFFALQPKEAILSDINPDLIRTYRALRDDPEEVHQRAAAYPLGKKNFYKLRAQEVDGLTPVQRAARFLFLNRFCFNGLYRTDESGHFNVPFAPQGTGGLPSREHLVATAVLLRGAKLRCGDFEKIVLKHARSGDFIYLDPPYALSNRRVFRQYGPNTFGLEDLSRLSRVLAEIDRRGARFVLSYADCPEARRAFGAWTMRRVFTQRNISGFARHRRRAVELILTNSH
jgi:DNA adenine methylase